MKKQTLKGAMAFACRLRYLVLIALLQIAFTNQTFAQSLKVSGTLKDNKGNPLQGVSVSVKGSQSGTTTDIDGKFNISVPNAQSILVYSLVGYGSKEQTVGTNTSISIALSEKPSDLDDVVVIGYGQSVARKNLTASVSTVTAKQIEERQPVSLFDALQGQAAGVLVSTENGEPNATGNIQIRSASTLNGGNGPLYVIDGIISENGNFLNPADIETIEILKDIASTAIYGARGANGVIIVTTKRGKEGRPMISANFYHLFGKLAHKLRTISADELRFYRRMRGDGNAGGNVDSTNPYLNADNDYQDLLFKTAHKQVASLSIGGGQKGMSYYAGLTYTDDRSIVLNSWAKRVQSKMNLSYSPNKKLTVSHTLAFSWSNGNVIPVGNSAKQVFERNPWTSIYRPDGTLAGYVESKRNPVAQALLNKNVDNDFVTQFNTTLMYNITKDLKFTTLFNAQLDNTSNKSFTPSSLTNGGTGDALGSNSSGKRFYWETQAYFNYTKRIGQHSITALAGFSADRRKSDNYTIGLYKYLSEEINTSAAATIDLTKTSTTASANSDASLFGRLGYSYAGKYILQGTYRRDGSSRFGDVNKWGNFYSGSAAWRFTDESFMKWTKGFLRDGKFRFSYGTAGNDRISDYPSYTLVEFGQYYNGLNGATPSTTLGNNKIQWESTTTTNYGLDLTFLNGRLTFSADYYIKTTNDLLYKANLPSETALDFVNINLGSIRNKGLELALTGTPIITKNFKWDISANVTFPTGFITKLNNGTSFTSGKYIIREGGKIGDFFLWKNLGVYQWDASNAYNDKGTRLTPQLDAAGVPIANAYLLDGKTYSGTVFTKSRNGIKLQGGDTEWLDLNNDNVIDDNDKAVVANATPDYFFGITNTFNYKNFSISCLFNGQVGNDIYNSVANGQNTFSSTYSPPVWDAALYSWQKQGDVSKWPLFSRKDTRGAISNGYNSLYIEDGSFIRLSSVRFSYSLVPKVAKKIGLRSATIFAYTNNPLTWTDYSWYDPELNSSNALQQGDDNGKYPRRRELGLGVNINL